MKTCTLKALAILSALIFMLINPLAAEESPAGVITITNVDVTKENCDKSNGSITITHDGTAPFIYTLNGIGTGSNTATGLAAGSYVFKVTDGTGCEGDTTIVIEETLPPVLTLQSKTDATCDMGGSATALSTDPSAIASWDSNPAQSGYDLIDVPAGTYTLTAIDSLGCDATLAVVIDAPGQMVIGVSSTPDTCTSGDGTATVAVQLNGVPPFSYQWGNTAGSQTSTTATNLEPGSYNVVVTDADGCEASKNVTVGLVENLDFTSNTTDATCFNGEDASIALNVTGGNGTYTYTWDPDVSTSKNADSLKAGDYTVTVSDAVGTSCEVTKTITVGEAPKINPVLIINFTSECGINDGRAFVTPRNVQGPYTMVWDTLDTDNAFQTGDTAKNLYPGVYDYRLTDSAGCSVKGRFVLISKNGLEVEVEVLQEDDCGLGDGIVKANVTNGTRPLHYKWFTTPAQNSTTEPFAFNLEQGTHLVVVKDTNDCVNQDAFVMTGNPPLKLKNKVTTPEYCERSNGTARAVFEGGTPPYTYSWNTLPVQTTATASGLSTGFYRVAIKDALGCRDSAQLYVEPEIGFDIETDHVDISCFGRKDGEASVKVTSGGSGTYSYIWNTSPPQNTKTLSGIGQGTYTVVVTDGEGCQRNATVVIENQNPIVSEFTFEPDTINPLYVGSAVVIFKNLSENAHHYRWVFGDGNESRSLDPTHQYLDTGTFVVSLFAFDEDEKCRILTQHGPFRVLEQSGARVANAFSPNGDGFNDRLLLWGQQVQNFSFAVFNRWGSEVFSTNSVEDSWDGRMKNGSPSPEGVYMYILKSVGLDGQLTEDKGTITLIR